MRVGRLKSSVANRTCATAKTETNSTATTAKQKRKPRIVVRASAKAMGDIIPSKLEEDAKPEFGLLQAL
jgi:hypothetical protein